MIDLYTWDTPNGRKVSILLEELGLDYTVHPVDLSKGEQFLTAFQTRFPNTKIPAITDRSTGVSMMESGVILIYLAKKTGRLIEDELNVLQWLMWQMGGFGPVLGQLMHFRSVSGPDQPYACDRFEKEALRLYGVLDDQLARSGHVAGALSIADMAIWPWVARAEPQGIQLSAYPHVRDWYRRLRDRPSFQRGYHVPNRVADIPDPA